MTKQKLAEIISNFGHPLLTFSVFIIATLFWKETPQKAIGISALIILGIFIPLTLKMYRGTQSGKYTNFDISDQKQRKSFYPTVLLLMAVVLLILYFTKQPTYIFKTLFLGFSLIFLNYLFNFFLKISLHVSLTLFLGFLVFSLHPIAGISIFIFAILMAWSRLELKRHSPTEILVGALIGTSIGILSWII